MEESIKTDSSFPFRLSYSILSSDKEEEEKEEEEKEENSEVYFLLCNSQ